MCLARQGVSLARAAASSGFADQAHFTRKAKEMLDKHTAERCGMSETFKTSFPAPSQTETDPHCSRAAWRGGPVLTRRMVLTGIPVSCLSRLAWGDNVLTQLMGGDTKEHTMTEEEYNIKSVTAYQEAFNRGDLTTALSYWGEPVENHGRQVSQAGIRMVWEDIRTRFPDAQLKTEEIVASANQVIVRNEYSGTHLGIGRLPIDGGLLVGVPPTGKKFAVEHIHWYKLKNRLIVGHRATRDDVGMMVQLGLIHPPVFKQHP
jgi:predicted ester cyclase